MVRPFKRLILHNNQIGTFCIDCTDTPIPPDLVVKSQATDIIDIILRLVRRPNGVYMACSNRKSRGELLSPSEVQWSTTKSDGVWKALVCGLAERINTRTWSLRRLSARATAEPTTPDAPVTRTQPPIRFRPAPCAHTVPRAPARRVAPARR